MYRPMLAANTGTEETLEAIDKHLRRDGFLYLQPKFDGFRCLFDNGIPRSRSWKSLPNKHLQQFAERHSSILGCLDVEQVPTSGDQVVAFRDAMSNLRRHDGTEDFNLFAFDIWGPDTKYLPYSKRNAAAQKIVSNLEEALFPSSSPLVICPTYNVTSMDEIMSWEEKLLGMDFEGIILRRESPAYKWGRSTLNEGVLMKLKRITTSEAIVIGYEPQYQNNNEALVDALGYTRRSAHQANLVQRNRLGALHCRLIAEPDITFKIGVFRGLGHSDLESLWEQRESLKGRICEFKHQAFSGGYTAPRSPVWLRWRNKEDMHEMA